MKAKLMLDVAPVRIKEINCYMTNDTRRNIVLASKKLKMYGKKCPVIARFDEYGRRLPDKLDLDTTHGITVKIIDASENEPLYLQMEAIEFPNIDMGQLVEDDSIFDDTYLPF